MENPVRVLLVEDVPEDAELLLRELRKAQLNVIAHRVDTERDLEETLADSRPDLILSDYNLPDFSGGRALQIAAMRCANVPFIFVSGTIGEERAIEALRHGAVDYVLKDNLARLGPAVRRALREAAERDARRKAERELEESESRFRLFMQHLPGAAFMKDLEGRITFANHGAETIIGKTALEIIGRPSQELFPSEYAATYLAHDQAAIEAKTMVAAVERVPMADGIHSFLTHRFPMLDKEGRPVLLGGIATDITERVRQEEKIRRLSRIHAVLSGINSTIVRVRERKELFREACRIAVDSGGFHMAWIGLVEPGQARARPVACVSVAHGYLDEAGSARLDIAENIAVAERALRQRQMVVVDDVATDSTIASTPRPGTYRSLAALPLLVEGEATGVLVLYAPEARFFDQDERKLLKKLAGDISFALDHIAKEEKLNYVAYYDILTGLANRELFFDRLTQLTGAAGTRRPRLGVLVVDLQRFRNINDSLGRSAGDKLLQAFAVRLQQTFDRSPTLARISGDRFAVVVDDLGGRTLATAIEHWIAQGLAQPFDIDGKVLRVACKIGIALCPEDGDGAETLFKNAEAALQRAKDTTELYAFYSPEMNARVAQRLHLESRLRDTVAKKQFILHYQPKVDLRTRRIKGLEALIRWRDPDLGAISPLEFIPLLEETGMIVEVGQWVIQQVVADMRRWQSLSLTVPRIAVNVSQVQVRQKGFVATVLAALGPEGSRPSGIDLEITESLIMDDTEASIDKLRTLRARGLHIVMDDFGTGFSSLSQIATLPLNALKIDRGFVARMADSADAAAIVSTVIKLAQALRIGVIAEGVETDRQAKLLVALGCDQAQGYLFGRPMAAETIAELLAETLTT